MKPQRLSLAVAALLAVGGLWFTRSTWRTDPLHKTSIDAGVKTPDGGNFDSNSATSLPKASQTGPDPGPNIRPQPGQLPSPPHPSRRFTDFTPEERVQFARQGHGPGG